MNELPRKICVLGTGSYGSAIANYIAGNHAEDSATVTLYGRDAKTVDSVNRLHTNSKYLPGLTLEHNLTATASIEEALSGSDLVVLGVPSQSIRELVLEGCSSFETI